MKETEEIIHISAHLCKKEYGKDKLKTLMWLVTYRGDWEWSRKNAGEGMSRRDERGHFCKHTFLYSSDFENQVVVHILKNR